MEETGGMKRQVELWALRCKQLGSENFNVLKWIHFEVSRELHVVK